MLEEATVTGLEIELLFKDATKTVMSRTASSFKRAMAIGRICWPKISLAWTQTAKISTAEPASVSVTGSSENGRTLYGVCASCHGADGAGNKALNAPRISGQKAWYVARQLANFKSGIRGSHEKDIYGQQMRPMALTLTSDAAINNVAAYIATLK